MLNESRNIAEKVFVLLTRPQKVKTALLILLTLISAAMETLGIASVTPFLAVLASPESIQDSDFLSWVYTLLGTANREQFLTVLGVVAFVGLVSGTGCRALNNWGQVRFSRSLECALASRLMRDYLCRPYAFFLNRNSADLTKMVLSEVGQVVSGFLTPAIAIISNTATAIFLLTLLCLVDPVPTLVATFTIGAIYTAVFLTMRRWLVRLGERRFKANRERFESASEVFGGIKEIKLLGNEPLYLKRFSRAFSRMARTQANATLAGALPVYALELIGYGGGLLVAVYLLQSTENFARALPLIALYILSARRMLPAIQNIFKSVTTLRYAQPAVNGLLQDFDQFIEGSQTEFVPPAVALPFEHQAIVLENVSFRYPNARKSAITEINLEVPIGARVGFVGSTGSGKTTTVDIILGLISPSAGRLLVDGALVDPQNLRTWQANLGYVPQHIYLADDTVSANIALGLHRKHIVQDAVEKAARLAQIHDFVIDEMPQGYLTMVGERGVRLSGGQRQRIGIARALYRGPKVLLFDEATSALDNRTEKAVVDGLKSLGRDRTMIFVAHRLSTVRDCDIIYLFAGGRIKASGTYDELTAANAEFQSLAVPG